ncbi:hypothetical protein L6452_02221 [Arctium lappa]|uniref:Uncharacterized protein n=1 Tax=Arctium lappa TaxID=4217 RepID=A0ACB9FI88_ARCLA|nr:hypothetical protein L6452_02221 [Arctium lappa]
MLIQNLSESCSKRASFDCPEPLHKLSRDMLCRDNNQCRSSEARSSYQKEITEPLQAIQSSDLQRDFRGRRLQRTHFSLKFGQMEFDYVDWSRIQPRLTPEVDSNEFVAVMISAHNQFQNRRSAVTFAQL